MLKEHLAADPERLAVALVLAGFLPGLLQLAELFRGQDAFHAEDALDAQVNHLCHEDLDFVRERGDAFAGGGGIVELIPEFRAFRLHGLLQFGHLLLVVLPHGVHFFLLLGVEVQLFGHFLAAAFIIHLRLGAAGFILRAGRENQSGRQ